MQGETILCEDRQLTGDEPASMNMWGFKPSFLSYLETRFEAFLQRSGNDRKAELFLPDVVDAMIRDNLGEVRILHSDAEWCGMTRREDKDAVFQRINSLVQAGEYPDNLWTGEIT